MGKLSHWFRSSTKHSTSSDRTKFPLWPLEKYTILIVESSSFHRDSVVRVQNTHLPSSWVLHLKRFVLSFKSSYSIDNQITTISITSQTFVHHVIYAWRTQNHLYIHEFNPRNLFCQNRRALNPLSKSPGNSRDWESCLWVHQALNRIQLTNSLLYEFEFHLTDLNPWGLSGSNLSLTTLTSVTPRALNNNTES